MAHPSGLLSLISLAVAPVVLITTTAILLSGYITKHISISAQMRTLAAEYRDARTAAQRQRSLHRQLSLFRRRINAVWAASALLYLALLLFLTTVLAVIATARAEAAASLVGVVTLILGLLMMVVAVVLELHEIGLARRTVIEELTDIFPAAAGPAPGDAAMDA